MRRSFTHLRLIGLLGCSALLSVACAHALDANPDTASGGDGASSAGTTPSMAGASASPSGGSPSGGAGNSSSGGAADSGGTTDSGGATDVAGSSSNGGQLPNAGASGATQSAGGSSGSGNAAATGGSTGTAGGTSAGGSAGLASAGGGSGNPTCKVTIDLNVYTLSKAGCGNYTSCKGQIHWQNDEPQALNKVVLSFSEPPGVTCTTDNSNSKWVITDNAATSHRCVFTATGMPWSVASMDTFGFGYDTNQANATVPTNVTISDPSCN